MRLCRFDDGYGLIQGEEVIDITHFVPLIDGKRDGDRLILALPSLRTLTARDFAQAKRYRLIDIRLLSPISKPSKILAAPNNYKDHTAEMLADPTALHSGRLATMAEAGLFMKATTSLVGPSEGITIRFPERRTDHEVELVAIIGESIAQPMDAAQVSCLIAGYSIGLDITLRGPEERSLRKSIDSYTVLGPALVTADEAGDLSKAAMKLSVNGMLRQSTTLSDMIFDALEQISYASQFYTLLPGDLFYTGTPAGVGPIKPGDIIHAEIDNLGTLDVSVH